MAATPTITASLVGGHSTQETLQGALRARLISPLEIAYASRPTLRGPTRGPKGPTWRLPRQLEAAAPPLASASRVSPVLVTPIDEYMLRHRPSSGRGAAPAPGRRRRVCHRTLALDVTHPRDTDGVLTGAYNTEYGCLRNIVLTSARGWAALGHPRTVRMARAATARC
eukprot:scaffold259963_cov30-Tisochrysis_lutea.AAC.2